MSEPESNKFRKHKRNYSSINSSYQIDNPDLNKNKESIVEGKEKESIGEKVSNTSPNIGNNTVSHYIDEDSLFLKFKNKGIIDADLDTKINDYRTNLSTNSNNTGNYYSCGDTLSGNSSGGVGNFNSSPMISYNNTLNLSLKIEFNILKNSLDSSTTQLYNLQSILSMKEKKMEILDNALKNIQERKVKILEEETKKKKEKESLINQNSIEQSPSTNKNVAPQTTNGFKRNRKTNSVNIPNVSEFLMNEDVSNISFKNTNGFAGSNNKINCQFESSENILRKELESLKQKNQEEIQSTIDNLSKQSMIVMKNEKIKFEEKLRELNSDNNFLLNNLQNEFEFMVSKIKSKEESLIDKNRHTEEIESENLKFAEKKKNLNGKLNYYKSIIANVNTSRTEPQIKEKINENQTSNEDEINNHGKYPNQINITQNSNKRINTNELSEDDKKINKNLNNFKVNNQVKYTKGHFRSQSLNNLFAKKNQQNSLNNIEYDFNYKTNQESFHSSKLKDTTNVKALQLVYTLDNQEMRPVSKIYINY